MPTVTPLLSPSKEEARAEEAAASEAVLTLHADNFDDAIAKHPFILVEFFSPCGVQPWRGKSPHEIYQLVVLKKEKPIFPYNLPAKVEIVFSGCFEYDFRDRPLMSDILQAFESTYLVNIILHGNGKPFPWYAARDDDLKAALWREKKARR
ncbi:hypothetical protein ZWY2020_016599 [Hordeum vulgare]|nr:hypothetical protein ZWY2020_016599 [Hordeum vulgare]